MTTDDLLQALARLRVETGSLACLGCGREHNCSTKGCRILREAADLIRQLSDENTELREEVNLRGNAVRTAKRKRAKAEAERDALREKVPQWISVEDRLPEDHLKRYLIAFKDAGGSIVDAARYIPGLGWECYNWDVPQKLITHWMPLPEAPEGGETHGTINV